MIIPVHEHANFQNLIKAFCYISAIWTPVTIPKFWLQYIKCSLSNAVHMINAGWAHPPHASQNLAGFRGQITSRLNLKQRFAWKILFISWELDNIISGPVPLECKSCKAKR